MNLKGITFGTQQVTSVFTSGMNDSLEGGGVPTSGHSAVCEMTVSDSD